MAVVVDLKTFERNYADHIPLSSALVETIKVLRDASETLQKLRSSADAETQKTIDDIVQRIG